MLYASLSNSIQHMTCVQPSCKYQVRHLVIYQSNCISEQLLTLCSNLSQFCWECAGDYHTSTSCIRPKIKIGNNSVLVFDELDKQCANHFLAKKIAAKGRAKSYRQLETCLRIEESAVLRVVAEGWNVLADAQSALAHSCIVLLYVKSAKLTFLFEHHKATTIALQQNFEEAWLLNADKFPLSEAKAAILDLRVRTRDYLLAIHTEIIVEREKQRGGGKSAQSPSPSRLSRLTGSSGASGSDATDIDANKTLSSVVFGDSFGTARTPLSVARLLSADNRDFRSGMHSVSFTPQRTPDRLASHPSSSAAGSAGRGSIPGVSITGVYSAAPASLSDILERLSMEGDLGGDGEADRGGSASRNKRAKKS